VDVGDVFNGGAYN